MSSEQETMPNTAEEATTVETEPQPKRAEEETTTAAAPKEETKEVPAEPAEVVPVIGIDFGNQNLVAALGFDRERLPLIVPNNLGTLTTPFVFFSPFLCVFLFFTPSSSSTL